ncbi:hypothetical protein NP493_1094g03016 [Ridgeia piscesae]|uniref:Uncharacterized protein n=1 Tax=Ridgeia piscesae TaxID=27915 RepID=A0AAD9KH09_RIDPI|nr:hypothetical protein NP493_1094g03016 [Ridgeia piscesae]
MIRKWSGHDNYIYARRDGKNSNLGEHGAQGSLEEYGDTVVTWSSRGFKSVPATVPEGSVEIDMNANPDMTKLTLHEVKPPSLRKLRGLIIRTCPVRQISADVFKLLPSLGILDLSRNGIEQMPVASGHTIANIESGAFREMALLMRFDLSRNRLSSVGASAFAGLANLRHLDLTGNQLGLVEDDSSRTLATLHHLDVSRNRLPWIPRGLPLRDWFDISHNAVRNVSDDQQAGLYPLEVMNLAHNPLHSDCHMLWLKELFDSRENKGGDAGSDSSGATSPADVLRVSLGAVRVTTVEIASTVASREIQFSVQHYGFGQRAATVRYMQISATLRQYMLRRLHPATSYMVCVVPHVGGAVDGNSVTTFSFDH